MAIFTFQEDLCSSHPVPGYEIVEVLARLLADAACEEGSLLLPSKKPEDIIHAWNNLMDLDRVIYLIIIALSHLSIKISINKGPCILPSRWTQP